VTRTESVPYRDYAQVTDELIALRAKNKRLCEALRQILEDPDATILDSHRDDGWEALGS